MSRWTTCGLDRLSATSIPRAGTSYSSRLRASSFLRPDRRVWRFWRGCIPPSNRQPTSDHHPGSADRNRCDAPPGERPGQPAQFSNQGLPTADWMQAPALRSRPERSGSARQRTRSRRSLTALRDAEKGKHAIPGAGPGSMTHPERGSQPNYCSQWSDSDTTSYVTWRNWNTVESGQAVAMPTRTTTSMSKTANGGWQECARRVDHSVYPSSLLAAAASAR
jgi:hypothetical protein